MYPLLRKELIQTLGVTAARVVLTRFGYAHGWRVAETLRMGFPWDNEDEWRAAGARLHTIQGLVRAEVTRASVSTAAAEGIWHDSYEAEQHLLHLGRADEPVCWTLVGFAPQRDRIQQERALASEGDDSAFWKEVKQLMDIEVCCTHGALRRAISN
jgi:hypothetical protein